MKKFKAWLKNKNELVDVEMIDFKHNWICYKNEFNENIKTGFSDIILLQFTGLYDSTKWEELKKEEQELWLASGKNKEDWCGNEIYEGDKIKYLGYEVKNGKQIRPERVIDIKDFISDTNKIKNILSAGNKVIKEKLKIKD